MPIIINSLPGDKEEEEERKKRLRESRPLVIQQLGRTTPTDDLGPEPQLLGESDDVAQELEKIRGPQVKAQPELEAELDRMILTLHEQDRPSIEQRNMFEGLNRNRLLSGREIPDSPAVVGSVENTLALATSVGSSLVGGVAGIAGAVPEAGRRSIILGEDFDPFQAHVDIFNAVTGRFTYQPQTEAGQDIAESVFGRFEAFLEKARSATGDTGFDIGQRLPIGERGAALVGSAFSVLPDAALMFGLGALARYAPKSRRGPTPTEESTLRLGETTPGGKGPVSLRVASKVEEEALSHGAKMPAGHNSKVINVKLDMLDSLPGAKPGHIKTAEQARAAVQKATQEGRPPEIIVETVGGLPTRVTKGAESIMLMREAQTRGFTVQSVKVRSVERPERAAFIELQKIKKDAAKVNESNVKAVQQLRDLNKKFRRKAREGLAATLVDASANVKRRLLNEGGEFGRKAVRDMELIAGAGPRAHARFQDARASIYKGLGTRRKFDIGERLDDGSPNMLSEWDLFDRYLHSRRAVAIAKTKKEGGKLKFSDGRTAREHASNLENLKRELGHEKIGEFDARAKNFFETHLEQLRRLRDEGLISKREFTRMKDIEYLERQVINKIDPEDPALSRLTQNPMTVGESGIHAFRGGGKGGVVMDTETLMAEIIVRSENRIARNRANKQLFNLAKDDPNNGIVRLARDPKKRPPAGMELIKVRVDGETKGLYMQNNLAHEWVAGAREISAPLANAARIASGSAIVRPLATGYNPGFAWTNFFRDLVHVWRAGGDQYSSFAPAFLGQVTRDLARTAKDAFLKTDRYRDFIEEGGGMNFLTHQGQSALTLGRQHRIANFDNPILQAQNRFWAPKLRGLRDGASKINEFSELWVRLALRERALQNQVKRGLASDPIEATWIARRYLDFSQGGTVTKAMDNFVPYLNASVQALRTAVRGYKQSPGKAILRDFQLASVYAVHEAYNWLFHRETMEQLPGHRIREDSIFPTDMAYVDEQGNKRNLYVSVKKDQSVLPITAPFSLGIQRLATGKEPTDTEIEYVLNALPTATGIMPTLQAYNTYIANYNFWTNTDVWKGRRNIEASAETTESVDPIFNWIGEQTGLSPQRTQAAARTVLPRNTYVGFAGMGMNWWRQFMDEQDPDGEIESKAVAQMLAESPGLRRIFGQTHPNAVTIDNAFRNSRAATTKRELIEREYDEKIKELDVSKQDTIDALTKQIEETAREAGEPFLAQNLKDRLNVDIAIQRHLDELPPAKYTPAYWKILNSFDASSRAAAFYEDWRDEDDETRRVMEKVAGALTKQGTGFRSREFNHHFEKLKEDRGTERPVGIVEDWWRKFEDLR